MKKYIILSMLFTLFGLVSCYDDDSSLGTKDVGDITIGPLEDASIISYTKDFLAVTGICLFPLGWLFVFRNGCQGMGHTFVPMLSGVLEVSLRVVMVKLLTPYLAFRGVALAEVSAWIGAWIMLMITYWIYQERTDSFR